MKKWIVGGVVLFASNIFVLASSVDAKSYTVNLNPKTYLANRMAWSCVTTSKDRDGKKYTVGTERYSVFPKKKSLYMEIAMSSIVPDSVQQYLPSRIDSSLKQQKIIHGNTVYLKQNTSPKWVAYPATKADVRSPIFMKGMLGEVNTQSMILAKEDGKTKSLVYKGGGIGTMKDVVVSVTKNNTISRVEGTIDNGEGRAKSHRVCIPLPASSAYVTPPKDVVWKDDAQQASQYLLETVGKNLGEFLKKIQEQYLPNN